MRAAQDLPAELNASGESPRIEAKHIRKLGNLRIETMIAFASGPNLGLPCFALQICKDMTR
jgi:hypothetical protein